jgi:chemotaxis protein MotB
VSLEEKLLFKTASWDIDANGRNALRKLAGVLEKNPGIQVTIEGHTDNVPYNPGNSQLKDNWDLSVKRATTVVRVLLEGSKINPKRLTAAGRSEFLMRVRKTEGQRSFLHRILVNYTNLLINIKSEYRTRIDDC